MSTEPMTDERLEEIERQFRLVRTMFEKCGAHPGWHDFYMGEELLDEVKRLKEDLRIAHIDELTRDEYA